jgi:valyl-tRNA synthetase
VPQARDINLDIKRVVAYRYWCNKLWNAIRFAMMNLPPGFTPLEQQAISSSLGSWPPAARWILSRLNQAVDAVNKVRLRAFESVATWKCDPDFDAVTAWLCSGRHGGVEWS